MFIQVFCPFFECAVHFVTVKYHELFVDFRDESLIGHLHIFSPNLWTAFHFGYRFLCYEKILSLTRIFMFTFFIILGDGSKNMLLWFMSESVLPIFSSRIFILSSLTFRSSTHFEFIFVCSFRECCNFTFFTFGCLVFLGSLTEETVFSLLYSLASSVLDSWP